MRMALRFAAVVVVVVGGFVVVAPPASACSCGYTENAAERLSYGDAAFVGTVVDDPHADDELPDTLTVTWRFAVDAVYKGDLVAGEEIDVVTDKWGASCGFDPLGAGRRRALAVNRVGDEWRGGLCSSWSADAFDELEPLAATTTTTTTTTTASTVPGGVASADDRSGGDRDTGASAWAFLAGPVVAVASAAAVMAIAVRRSRALR